MITRKFLKKIFQKKKFSFFLFLFELSTSFYKFKCFENQVLNPNKKIGGENAPFREMNTYNGQFDIPDGMHAYSSFL